jgi:hypothetical protein
MFSFPLPEAKRVGLLTRVLVSLVEVGIELYGVSCKSASPRPTSVNWEESAQPNRFMDLAARRHEAVMQTLAEWQQSIISRSFEYF